MKMYLMSMSAQSTIVEHTLRIQKNCNIFHLFFGDFLQYLPTGIEASVHNNAIRLLEEAT